MSDTSKRQFWQFHLSTAVLLMFAAGAFVWIDYIPNSSLQFGPVYKWGYTEDYGCPYWFAYVRYKERVVSRQIFEERDPEPLKWQLLPGLMIDLGVYAMFLGLIICGSELWIKWRGRRPWRPGR